ncbi:MAG: lysylphosphatidylglycerol synthase transmembrane domain-containing protein [Gemmatimonadaceae bacterium]
MTAEAGPPLLAEAPSRLAAAARVAVKVLISAAIVWILLTRIPVAEVGRALRSVNAAFLLLAFALVPLYNYVAAAQQRVLTDHQGLALGTARILEINIASHFYGLFLPGYLAGGVLRWYRMSRGGKAIAALAAIAVNRLLEVVTLLLFGAVMWLVANPPGANAALTAFMLGALVGTAAVVATLFHGGAADRMSTLLSTKRSRWIPARAREKLAATCSAVARFGTIPARESARLTSLLLLRHALEFASFVLLAWAVGIHLSLPDLGWIRSFMALALMLPITYAGIGVRETTLLVTMQPYGVAAESAVALSVLLLARNLLGALAGGVWELKRVLRGSRGGGALISSERA